MERSERVFETRIGRAGSRRSVEAISPDFGTEGERLVNVLEILECGLAERFSGCSHGRTYLVSRASRVVSSARSKAARDAALQDTGAPGTSLK